ncbi:hypothetical protein SAMN05421788_108247 [Filimonas lacunae]|uniref:Beta-lactamase-inhibitor-like, PepSY-like n=1 Tax=Filimonas lacunae TaxID=477680 RepID=A0A173MDU9_9BACT|nr:hypothetical protein [Filimonas lacunae]BAV05608.1 hypothetical protein FLA_1619 [Filimonas lacunae]SIT29210.1 hypothetical protein SAMN05421788_108247 [Filimonas lacunae]
MKKLLIATLLLMVVTATAFAAGNAKVEAIFKIAYPGATHVHFKTVGELVSVSFDYEAHHMQAFYDAEGEQVAVSKHIDFNSLPMRGQATIKAKYPTHTTVEIIEMESQEEGVCFYVALLDGVEKTILRVSSSGREVTFFKKETMKK